VRLGSRCRVHIHVKSPRGINFLNLAQVTWRMRPRRSKPSSCKVLEEDEVSRLMEGLSGGLGNTSQGATGDS